MIKQGISEISPQFVAIYNQAFQAEQLGLNELNGIGYRKALEFLVKDFCSQENPKEVDKIKAMPLGQCIDKYIDDSNIKKLAKRATWLGNDEAHYVRKLTDKDVNALSKMIQLVCHWISMDYLTKEALKDM
ncbi:MAG: DUF4145 domain-containing protein [Cyanobacteria bacterium J06555_13]